MSLSLEKPTAKPTGAAISMCPLPSSIFHRAPYVALTHICQEIAEDGPRRILVVLKFDRHGYEGGRDDRSVKAREHQACTYSVGSKLDGKPMSPREEYTKGAGLLHDSQRNPAKSHPLRGAILFSLCLALVTDRPRPDIIVCRQFGQGEVGIWKSHFGQGVVSTGPAAK